MNDPASISRRALLAGVGLAIPAGAAPHGKVIDCHSHLAHHSMPNWAESDRLLVEAADKLGIDQLCCSLLPPKRPAPPESFRQCNVWAAEAVRRFPGRIRAWAFVTPGFSETLDEVRRCVEERGFIGVKLYNDYKVTDPVVRPLIELTIRLRVPILHHAGHPTWLNAAQPHISDGGDFAEAARQYPEARIICAHVSGGGDWEWTIKALRHAATVHLDLSGSNIDEGIIEMAHRMLGAGRLLFGCDLSMTASMGRMRAADLPAEDKRQILGANFERLLAWRG